MQGKFFKESTPTLFEGKIRSCITKVTGSKTEDLPILASLADCILELKKYTQDPQFATINLGLKGEAQKVLELMKELIPDTEKTTAPIKCFIQIPSKEHIAQMRGMPAGGEEDQCQRLMHMVETIEKVQAKNSSLPVITSSRVRLTEDWCTLFAAINHSDKEKALLLFNAIPSSDIVLKCLLAVHPREYLQKIIGYSIDAQRTGTKKINADILFTPYTFEILINDIAMTLLNPAKLHFSFGLPTHHAYSAQGSGFCILNKTAVLMKHAESTHEKPLKYIIIGTDVNRDNGLCNILMQSASHMDICHVDIFDSRVYPQQDHSFIDIELKIKGKEVGQKIKCWSKEQLAYFAVDLSLTTRHSVTVHPALLFALSKIQESIEQATKNEQKIVLFLPTGWDSHEDETAYCGKFVNGRMMGQSEAHSTRFNDGDLTFFYERILTIYNENKECIEGIYWGLEGGYDRPMYERQIKLMLQTLVAQLLHQDSDQNSHRIHSSGLL